MATDNVVLTLEPALLLLGLNLRDNLIHSIANHRLTN